MTPPPYGHVFLSRLLAGAGVTHLAIPRVYDAVIPRWVPGPPRLWTIASGLAEVGVAALLAVPATRRLGGWAAAALFVAVFPANVEMTRQAWRRRRSPRGGPALVATLLRLPVQVPLVVWSLRVGRARSTSTRVSV